MFRGVSKLNLDAKGRFAIPVKYRDELQVLCGDQLIVTVDPDLCLLVYPKPHWEAIETSLMQKSNMDKRVRRLQRLLTGFAVDCEMTAQGRIQLTPALREFAGLDKQVVLVGQGNKFELWDETRWHDLSMDWVKQEQDSDDLSEALMDISI